LPKVTQLARGSIYRLNHTYLLKVSSCTHSPHVLKWQCPGDTTGGDTFFQSDPWPELGVVLGSGSSWGCYEAQAWPCFYSCDRSHCRASVTESQDWASVDERTRPPSEQLVTIYTTPAGLPSSPLVESQTLLHSHKPRAGPCPVPELCPCLPSMACSKGAGGRGSNVARTRRSCSPPLHPRTLGESGWSLGFLNQLSGDLLALPMPSKVLGAWRWARGHRLDLQEPVLWGEGEDTVSFPYFLPPLPHSRSPCATDICPSLLGCPPLLGYPPLVVTSPAKERTWGPWAQCPLLQGGPEGPRTVCHPGQSPDHPIK
jgi:hypothetical protein